MQQQYANVFGSYMAGRDNARRNALVEEAPVMQGNPAIQGQPVPNASPQAIDIAGSALGLNESDKKAALQDYLTTGGVNIDPATRAWCADFTNATLAQAGMQGTGSGMARSFLEWGNEVSEPQRGDVAVFSRGDPNGPYGHVGFFDGYTDDGQIRVLGGNQGNAVSYSNYSPNALLGFRRG